MPPAARLLAVPSSRPIPSVSSAHTDGTEGLRRLADEGRIMAVAVRKPTGRLPSRTRTSQQLMSWGWNSAEKMRCALKDDQRDKITRKAFAGQEHSYRCGDGGTGELNGASQGHPRTRIGQGDVASNSLSTRSGLRQRWRTRNTAGPCLYQYLRDRRPNQIGRHLPHWGSELENTDIF